MNAAARQYFHEKISHGSRSSYARQSGISRSTLYYKPRQPEKDRILKEKIVAILRDHPFYGHRRIALVLGVNHKATERIMRLYGLRPRAFKKRRKAPYSGPARDPTPNLLKLLCPIAPDVAWAGDFTEFRFHGAKIYLATVIDVYTRELLGWQLSKRHNTRLVMDAMEHAVRRRGKAPHLFHSDQGSEYTGLECTAWIVSHGIRPSWSPKGKPWNNGHQESFYNTLKKEVGNLGALETIPDLYTALAEYICYYNEDRIHLRLKMTPTQYRQRWERARCPIALWTNQKMPQLS